MGTNGCAATGKSELDISPGVRDIAWTLVLRKAPVLPVLESWKAACSTLSKMDNSKNQRVRLVIVYRTFIVVRYATC